MYVRLSFFVREVSKTYLIRSKQVSIERALAPLSSARRRAERAPGLRVAESTSQRVESARAEARRAVAPWCCAFDPRGSTRGSAAGEKCVAETVGRPSPLVVSRIGRSSSNEAPPKTSPAPRVSRLQKCSRARRATGNRRARWLVPAARERAMRKSPSRAAEARACVAPSRAAAQCPDARRSSPTPVGRIRPSLVLPEKEKRTARTSPRPQKCVLLIPIPIPIPIPDVFPEPRRVPLRAANLDVKLSCPPPPQPP